MIFLFRIYLTWIQSQPDLKVFYIYHMRIILRWTYQTKWPYSIIAQIHYMSITIWNAVCRQLSYSEITCIVMQFLHCVGNHYSSDWHYSTPEPNPISVRSNLCTNVQFLPQYTVLSFKPRTKRSNIMLVNMNHDNLELSLISVYRLSTSGITNNMVSKLMMSGGND